MVINMQVKRSNGNKVLLTFYHRHQFRYGIASSKPIKYTESVYEIIIFAAVFELSSPLAVRSAHPRARAHAPRAPRAPRALDASLLFQLLFPLQLLYLPARGRGLV